MHAPHPKLWLYSAPAIVGALAMLWHYPVSGMEVFGLCIATLLSGWLAYCYFLPVQMIKRRALLRYVTAQSSFLRTLLWNSQFVKLVLAVTSVVTALFVLVTITALHPFEWYVLFGSIVSFLIVYRICTGALGGQLNCEHRFYFTLRIANRINLALMTTALVTVQILWLEVDDTRYLSISEVFYSAYLQHYASVTMMELGWLIGLNAAISASLWHVLEMTSQTEAAMLIKLLAWLIFLVFNAIKLGAIWTLLLGIPSWLFELLDSNKKTGEDNRHTLYKTLAAGIFLSATAYLLHSQGNVASLLKSLPSRLQQHLTTAPCRHQAPLESRALAAEADRALTAQQTQLRARMADKIEHTVDQAFALAENGVDNFLDWNFSLTGQYTQLWLLSKSMAGERSFTHLISERMDGHIADAMGPGLSALDSRLNLAFEDAINEVVITHGAFLSDLVQSANCATVTKPALPLAESVHKSLVGSGLAVGPAAGVLAIRAGVRTALPATRVAAGTGSRAAAKPGSKRILALMFSRLTGRIAAGTASGTAGTLCGPFTLACGSAFAVVTWVGMDLAINEIDEAINRQQMRADLLEALNETKADYKAQLKQQYFEAADLAFAAVDEYQDRTFNIHRDGLRATSNMPEQL